MDPRLTKALGIVAAFVLYWCADGLGDAQTATVARELAFGLFAWVGLRRPGDLALPPRRPL